MPEFTEFQQDAIQLPERLTRNHTKQLGCISFFSGIIPDNSSAEDAYTISLLAKSLDLAIDDLLNYLKSINRHSVVSTREVEEFKNKTLIGIYLLMWSHYNTTVSHYMNPSLIRLFQQDLEIQSPLDLDSTLFNSSLLALSQYCSYVYENRCEFAFDDLNQRLGDTIQLDIHKVRSSKFNSDNSSNSSWYGIYTGLMCKLGMNNTH